MNEKLKSHCDVISGYAFKSTDWSSTGVPVIKIGNISNGEDILIDSETQFIDNSLFQELNEKFVIKRGDILISLTGSHINQPNSMVGRSCRCYSNLVFALNQRAGKIIPKEGTDIDYLYYLFNTKAIKYDIANRAYGGANQVNVSPNDIKRIRFHFPELPVQSKIGKILSTYDQLIYINNKRIKILEQMVENLYKEWFVRFRFPGHKTVGFETGSPKGWILFQENEPKIPKGWHYGKFCELGNFVRGKNITSAEMIDGSIPVIAAGLEPSGYHNEANVHGRSLTISASGANAGFMRYNLDDIWAADCSYYQNEDNFWFAYSTLKFLQPVINNLQCGAAQPHVHPKHINRLSVLIPSTEMIHKYCGVVEPFFNEIKSLITRNDNLIRQRDLLLPRLMSGKLEV